MPPRPKKAATRGTLVLVFVNHFRVVLDPNIEIHKYEVTITQKGSAKALPRGLNRAVYNELVRLYRHPTKLSPNAPHLGGRQSVYDGLKNMFCNGKLPGNAVEFWGD
eukprot:TRINITY_DN10023_c0_g1_i1.p2 TRINITY_DN10023_c0_g1~~TRINITY_DN10023_c0_g1_i1.p2  ORF type:complete len:107 (+),score=13.41 TRINITY_DN10023_c0_g1_i1:253-573(+)